MIADYKYIFDSAPFAYFILSLEGKILAVNVQGIALIAQPNENLLEKSFGAFLTLNSKNTFNEFLLSLKRTNQKQSCVVNFETRENKSSSTQLSGVSSNNSAYFQIVAQDSLYTDDSESSYKTKYKEIENVAVIGRWELDLHNNALSWSPKIYEIFDIDPTKFPPTYEGFLSVIHPEDLEIVNTAYTNSLIDKQKYEIDHRLLMKDGSIKWVRETSYTDFDESGKPLRSVGTCQDITDKKVIKLELQASESKYSSLVENAKELIWKCDAQARFTYLNPSWEKVFGIPREEMLGQVFGSFQSPEIYARDIKEFRKLLQGSSINNYETNCIAKDGTVLTLVFNARPQKDKSGSIIGTEGTAIDVTEKKISDLKLEETYFELGQRQFAIDQHAIVAITNLAGDIVYVNKMFCEISKYSRQELLGQNHRIINSKHHPKEFFTDMYETIKSGQTWHGEIKNRAKDGTFYWVATTIAPLKNSKGIIRQYLAIRTEITKIKEAEEKIKILLEEKELILVEVHHRIKNNMNTIYSLLKIQANAQTDAKDKDILLSAASRVQSMMILYDKLYRSKNTNEISIQDYIPVLITEILNVFPNNDLVTLKMDFEPIVLSTYKVSPLGIIINELVTNSMKYSFMNQSSGNISVKATKLADKVTIVYEDDGIPLDASVTLENANGFGLKLVGMLMRQIKGTVHIERGHGTKYIFEINHK
jgi:PAS domain S-box-containing protein